MPKSRTRSFDTSDFLDDDEIIAEYLTAALEESDPDVFLTAIGQVAKARGMTRVADRTGLGRESLYKALAPGAKPRYDTVLKVLQSLGVKLVLKAV
jgi:probable addiction module antidote protein